MYWKKFSPAKTIDILAPKKYFGCPTISGWALQNLYSGAPILVVDKIFATKFFIASGFSFKSNYRRVEEA